MNEECFIFLFSLSPKEKLAQAKSEKKIFVIPPKKEKNRIDQ